MTKIQKTSVVLLILLLGGMHVSKAQFWKKVAERATNAAEETVLRKTEEKATEKTEKAMDSVFQMPKKRKKKTNTESEPASESDEMEVDENIFADNNPQEEDVNLAESYAFEWKYVMQMESAASKKKKEMGDMKITYFLSPQSTAFATKFDMGNKQMDVANTMMVMDLSAGVNFTLMEINGEKIIQKMPSMADAIKGVEEADDNTDNINIKKIGTKEILGYTCQGFEIQLEEGTSIVYINPNAPVSFNHGGNPKFAPKGFKQEWLKEFKNGLMMEMTFTSNKKAKHNMKMTCVELIKEPFTIQLNEYKSIMDMGKR